MLTKIAYKKEPKLSVHKYVVTISKKKEGVWHTSFKYCVSQKEVKAVANKASKGSIIEVFSAVHNFVQAYEKA